MPDGEGQAPNQRVKADDDPLINPPANGLGGWLVMTKRIAARSGQSILAIAMVGIALPCVVISMTTDTMGVRQYLPPDIGDVHGLLVRLPDAFVQIIVTVAVIAAAAYVSSAAWAAGVWVIVEEGANGARASVPAAFRYGFVAARSLWPWSLAVGAAVELGLLLCLLPGLYAAYACSLFSFVMIFERSVNPVARSIGLTHGHVGAAAARISVSLIPYAIYTLVQELIVNTTFKAVLSLGAMTGTTTTVGSMVLRGMLTSIQLVLLGPTVAAILIGLFATYAELRADGTSLSTGQLRTAMSTSSPAA